ncbi:hypothetical protein [uncultured Ferrimonas sp.]|uniref:hypothetical protein n=1 Tax=uncultured Ferrimonas sp. TaxID=432640 RepID=UPI0026168B26|nr:hypothetical protein [uncultured Ferrimonas sp.]
MNSSNKIRPSLLALALTLAFTGSDTLAQPITVGAQPQSLLNDELALTHHRQQSAATATTDTDGDGISDSDELAQGSDPLQSNLLDYRFEIAEDFTEIDARDSAVLDAAAVAALTPKQAQFTSLQYGQHSGTMKFDVHGGEAVFGDFDLTMNVNNALCDRYDLSFDYGRSSRKLVRSIAVNRLNDDSVIKPLTDIASYRNPRTETFSLEGSSDSDQIHFEGRRMWLGQVNISGQCTLLDLDLDTLPDRLERLLGTDPLRADTDQDGIDDRQEYDQGSDPFGGGDDDNDGIPNETEVALGLDPNNPADALLDLDSDGMSNVDEFTHRFDLNDPRDAEQDADNDGFSNRFELDNHLNPRDPSDGRDGDSDNDGVNNGDDAFIHDPQESLDSDSDGIGNNADNDDDNDGVNDSDDAFPLDPAESLDSDNDGIGNNIDNDDDNDGVNDGDDAFPLDPTESLDSDNDGIGDNQDPDDDNDGLNDDIDPEPTVPDSGADSDGDGWSDHQEITQGTDPYQSNLQDYAVELLETFAEVAQNDSSAITDEGFARVTPKQLGHSRLQWSDYQGGLFDRHGGFAVFNDMEQTFTVSNLLCDRYTLSTHFGASSGRGERAITITRSEDGTEIQPYMDIAPLGRADYQYPIDSIAATETLVVTGRRLWLREMNISAQCQLTDWDLDTIADKVELLQGTDPKLADTDGDGSNDNVDLFPTDGNDYLDFDNDGIGDNADSDDDNDGVNDADDAFPFDASETLDTDNDGIGNNVDDDDDGDGVNDADDAFPLDGNETIDSDHDGIGDNSDPDNDNDGVNNGDDAFPLDPSESLDSDNDGIGNNADSDDDGDGIDDPFDPNPTTPDVGIDQDGDGWPDQYELDQGTDPSQSNLIDYHIDLLETFAEVDQADTSLVNDEGFARVTPKQLGHSRLQWSDYQGGLFDRHDGFAVFGDMEQTFTVSNLLCDSYTLSTHFGASSGRGERAITITRSEDGTEIQPYMDIAPLGRADYQYPIDSIATAETLVVTGRRLWLREMNISAQCQLTDWDLDTIPDRLELIQGTNPKLADTDGDGSNDNVDLFPTDGNDYLDFDNDGIGDNADLDDDNDGVNDADDAFPFDDSETLDTDNDGIGNNVDDDDDGDGVNDADDAFPLDGSETIDSDHDGIGNNADDDDDGDGSNDRDDAFPLDPSESLDSDNDGIGNNADNDDDGDGIDDQFDPNPTTPDVGIDQDGDGWPDQYELEQGTDPSQSNRIDYHIDLLETFAEVDQADSSAITDAGFARVSGKQQRHTRFQWSAYQNGLYDRDGNFAVFGDMTQTFTLNNMLCDSYTLVSHAGQSSGSGTRTLSISRSEDGLAIQPQIHVGGGGGADRNFQIDTLGSTETIVVVGNRMRLERIGVQAQCQLMDWDLDTLPDQFELSQGTNPKLADSDNDGLDDPIELAHGLNPIDPADGSHADTDGDGINNGDEIAFGFDPLNGNDGALDSDSDGIPNHVEISHGLNPHFYQDGQLDLDGDGISNRDEHRFGLDLSDPSDAEQDLDNDGISNRREVDNGLNPTDPSDAELDADGDGVANRYDQFINDASEAYDSDNDGIGDNRDPDDDNDGVNDPFDALPFDPNEQHDHDHDGIGDDADTDDDNDGINDADDAFPLDPTESQDSDNDGIGNNADRDSDNDGINDDADPFPTDPTEWRDSDGDGIGNNADSDDDNDGVNDLNDAFPLDPNETVDTDHDGIGNNADPDDDNDTILDGDDEQPLIANRIYQVDLLEDFSELVGTPDNADFTDPLRQQLTVKVSDDASLQLRASGAGQRVDDANNFSIYGGYQSLNFELAGLQCPNYTLTLVAGRMTSGNVARYVKIVRENDDVEVLPFTDVSAGGLVTYSAQIDGVADGMPEQLQLLGRNSLINSLRIEANCVVDAIGDSDMDGLTDVREAIHGTDATNPDTDGDGLRDGDEVRYGLDPLDPSDGDRADSDHDGISNADELKYGLDPLNPADAQADADGDGASNYDEIRFGYAPLDASERPADSDNDGVLDQQEQLQGTNPYQSNLTTYQARAVEDFRVLSDVPSHEMFVPEMAAKLTPKQHMATRFELIGYGDAQQVYQSNGTSVWNHLDMHYQINSVCPSYDLTAELGASSSGGARTSWVERLADGTRLSDNWSLADNPGRVDYHSSIEVAQGLNSQIRIRGSESMLWKLAIAESCQLFDSDMDGLGDVVEAQLGTDPSNRDSDQDGISDGDEAQANLNPLDNRDGANVDSDGDGVNNGLELEHGFDPLDGNDMDLVDSDNDGINNRDELDNGLDPFDGTDLHGDLDNDGISNRDELANNLNPNDPSDGANSDTDGDGINNGDEINAGLNPNDHMLQLPDTVIVSLLAMDTNGDNRIDDWDQPVDIKLQRYSLRSEQFQLGTIDPKISANGGVVRPTDIPEVRTFRGQIVGEPDSNINAVIMPDCSISYSVFLGYNAAPYFELSADGSIYNRHQLPLADDSICATDNPTLAKYQMAWQPPLENWNDVGPMPTEDQLYIPQNGDDYHVFRRDEAMQISYQVFSHPAYGNNNIAGAMGYAEFHNLNSDYAAMRQYHHRIIFSDMMVEVDGNNTDRARFRDNFGNSKAYFWDQRVQEGSTYYELGWWVSPGSSHGLTNGWWWQATPGWGNQPTAQHEMGHIQGCKHECSPERVYGSGPMRGGNGVATSAPILVQRTSANKNEVRWSNGSRLLDMKRVSYPRWPVHPVAQPDHASVLRDQSTRLDVISNDWDPNNTPMQITEVVVMDTSTPGASGSQFTINGDDSIDFTPPKGWIGQVEAFYVLEDASGQSTRGILHLNVEAPGISDYYSLDANTCVENDFSNFNNSMSAGLVNDIINIYDSPVPLMRMRNWGYKGWDPEINQDNPLNCDSKRVENGAAGEAVNYQLSQWPFYQRDQVNDGHKGQHHPHIWEINDQNFSYSMWFRNDDTMIGRHELASRGRLFNGGWVGDGWIISTIYNPEQDQYQLQFAIHDKNATTRAPLLTATADVPTLADSDRWHHVAMTVDWAQRTLNGYVDGVLATSVEIPAHFSYVSTSGTGQTYGRGSYAKAGQTDSAYTTTGNNGIDEIIVAHEAFSAEQIAALYQQRLPALSPFPGNGQVQSLDAVNLSWSNHSSLQAQILGYRLYLSSDAGAVERGDSSALHSALLPSNSVSLGALAYSASYYWRVDTLLDDGSEVQGNVWSLRAPESLVIRPPAPTIPDFIPDEEVDYGDDDGSDAIMDLHRH